MQSADLIPERLALMLKQINLNEGFRKFLKKNLEKLNFDKKNILNLTQEKVETLFLSLKNKHASINNIDQSMKNSEASVWLQNELRIFIYVLCGHLFLNKTTILELKHHDYSLLQQFFPNKKQQHLQYQVKLLVNKKNPKWSFEQSKLFKEIMSQNIISNRWNFIAKELFTRSGKKYFKTPKQCRQRWINHEDPSKLKGNWETSEDINLLTNISNIGKKWTLIAREMNDTRTQNSVKNRYNSLIKMAKRQYGNDKSQQTLVKLILKKKYAQSESVEININQSKIQQQCEKQQSKTPIQVLQAEKCQKNISSHQFMRMEDQMNFHEKKKPETHLKNINFDKQLDHSEDVFKYVFQESQELQNIEWNNSQSISRFNQAFYFTDGNFCFDGNNFI